MPWFTRILQWLLQPLTIAQGLSSAAGAGAMLIAAAKMHPAQFTQFSLFTLAGALLLGLAEATLLQPALIAQRRHADASVPFRYALAGALSVGVLFGSISWLLGVRGTGSIVLLAGSAVFPVLHDWLRYRAMAQDKRWAVAQSDLLRFLLTMASLAIPGLVRDSIPVQIYLSLSTIVPMLFLLWKLPPVTGWLSYRRYSDAAGWQLVDFVVGQSLISLPLLFLGSGSTSPLIGGVRLAQSLLGPLNLVFAASAMNLVADAATREELASPRSVISRGITLGRFLGAISALGVASMLTLAFVTGISLKGVSNRSLVMGLLLVGAASSTTSWSGVHAVVLRVLHRQSRATLGRTLIAVPTVSAFTLGYFLYGIDTSLTCGFVTLGITSPLVFLTLSARVYRKM